MKVHLEGDYYLMSTDRQYTITEEKTSKDGKTGEVKKVLKNETFHSTIESALHTFLQRKLMKSSVTTFEGILKKLKEHEKLLEKWLKEAKLDIPYKV